MTDDTTKPLQYHQRVFDFLGEKPVRSPQADDIIRAIELSYGIQLPPSLKEWFSLEDATTRLSVNDNHVLPIDRFQLVTSPLFNHHPDWRIPAPFSRDLFWWVAPYNQLHGSKLFKIVVENQGVCMWAVHLNGSPDPPVMVKDSADNSLWQPVTETFSDFVFAAVLDSYWLTPCDLNAHTRSLTFSDLGYLESQYGFIGVSSTNIGPGLMYRFGWRDKQVGIYTSQGQVEDKRYQWVLLHSPSLTDFEALVRDIWHLGDLSETLQHHDDNSEEAALLRKLRSE